MRSDRLKASILLHYVFILIFRYTDAVALRLVRPVRIGLYTFQKIFQFMRRVDVGALCLVLFFKRLLKAVHISKRKTQYIRVCAASTIFYVKEITLFSRDIHLSSTFIILPSCNLLNNNDRLCTFVVYNISTIVCFERW